MLYKNFFYAETVKRNTIRREKTTPLAKIPYKKLEHLLKKYLSKKEHTETRSLIKKLSIVKKRGYLKKEELPYNFSLKKSREENGGETYVVGWEEIVTSIVEELLKKKSTGIISYKFHLTMSEIIKKLAEISKEKKVILLGGCFQNKFLLEKTKEILAKEGFSVYFNQRIPPNDGGISFGQAVALNYLK